MHRSLYFWVILAILAGIGLGVVAPEAAQTMKPLSDGFIKLVKMMIAPIVFCTVTLGITGMRSVKNAGRVGLKALIYFEVMTTVALVLGLVVINFTQPGAAMRVDPASLDAGAVSAYTASATTHRSITEFLLGVIPPNITAPLVNGDMLSLLLVSVLFACGMLAAGDHAYHLRKLLEEISAVLFKLIGLIVWLAPLGAFGAMAFTVGKYGVNTLEPLLRLMADFYLTCVLFVGVVLSLVLRAAGFHLWSVLKYVKEELLLVLGTSSSETVLPRLMEKMERLGCSRAVVGLVVPTGYSFNLDGTCIYLTMATVFIAQAVGIDMSLADQLLVLAVLLLTSKGAAGVTGSGFVVLAGTLATVGHVPVAGLALILGIDRFMSEARAITNFIGNTVATLVVARWERAIDMETATRVLNAA